MSLQPTWAMSSGGGGAAGAGAGGSAGAGAGSGAAPKGLGSAVGAMLSKVVRAVFGPAKVPGSALAKAAQEVNPLGGGDNCGYIIDAVAARLRGTDPTATAPDAQDGAWSEIESRFDTTIGWNSSLADAYDAVRKGGDGTMAVVGIQYSGGTAAHVVILANDGGVVGIVEGQDWGAGSPAGVITDVARANERYNSDGGSNIGWGIVP